MEEDVNHIMIFGRYCNASAKCTDWISSLPAKSAIVRDNFKMCFGGIHFRDEHALVSIGASRGGHRQNPACMTDDSIQGKLADDEGIVHHIVGKKICKDDDTQRDGEVVGGTFLADHGRREIDNDAMTGKMQTRILDGSLHALAALLHGSIRQAHNCHAGTKKPLNFRSKLTHQHSKRHFTIILL